MSVWRFENFTLDASKRELRRGSEIREVQPQVFDLIVYLVKHRERVVAKRELLEELWKDTTVTDSSLQRAVSLARQALSGGDDDSREKIETHSRRGYRFVGRVDDDEPARTLLRDWPPPAYLETRDGVHLAWRAFERGAGDPDGPDVVLVPGWSFPMESWVKHPRPTATLIGLRGVARIILFDRRGVGLSDRLKQPATLEERARDLEAVLDAAGSKNAILLGVSEGASLVLSFAAEHPDRVRGLILVGAFARMAGSPFGWSQQQADHLRDYVRHGWGRGATVLALVPAHANDPEVQRWAAEVERTGASPGAALDLLEMNLALDARPLLERVRARTIVLHHREDRVVSVENGREVARALHDVRYVEASGSDHMFLFEDHSILLEAVASMCRER